MEERRRVPRHRTLKSGKIVVQSGRWVVDCTVRNLSTQGALLLVRSLAAIPEKFDLVLETTGEHHSCRIAWRGEDRLGVEFSRAS
jgi:PilZ domain